VQNVISNLSTNILYLNTYYNEGKEIEWSGNVLPDSNKVKDRLTFKSFIEFSLALGFPSVAIHRAFCLLLNFMKIDH